ncbi:hypothetical protein [Heyndrickxia faecalis]
MGAGVGMLASTLVNWKFGDPPKNLSERTKGLVNRGVDKAKKMDQNLSRRKKRHRHVF